MSIPALIFHDRNDKEVPYKHGVAIAQAWSNARLITASGLGHRRIYRDY